MELSVRDWMIIVGVLLIVAVLLDGYRRVRNERRGNIRVALNKQFLNSPPVVEVDERAQSELPGRARPASRLHENQPAGSSDVGLSVKDLQLEQDVPMLMESVDATVIEQEQIKNTVNDESVDQHVEDHFFTKNADSALFSESSDYQFLDGEEERPCYQDDQQGVKNASGQLDRKNTASPYQQQGFSNDTKKSNNSSKNSEVIVVNVVAKAEPFKGPDLLHILLACDVRFGKMSIFHRHEKSNGSGEVQFSVANSVEPGGFDLDTIDDFTTPGVCFFMSVPGPENVIEAFDCLVQTAKCLVKNLNGELRDESRSVMTTQTLEHCRQRLVEFERRKLTQPV